LGEHRRCPWSLSISFSPSRRKGKRQSGLTAMNKPGRILIVDDSETNRDILVTRLSSHGYECLQAADGEEALAATAQHRPDLILLDVMMPKLDGFEVCRRPRGVRRTS
jgi:CheY-like chemotaxis protein